MFLRLALGALFFMLLRRFYLMFTRQSRQPNQRSNKAQPNSAPNSAEEQKKSWRQQDISDADYEEIP